MSLTPRHGPGLAAKIPADPGTNRRPNASSDDSRPLAAEVRGLVKTYGGLTAVAGIGFEFRRGEIFALLGPNGAGKTTTVEIPEGYRARDGGQMDVLGSVCITFNNSTPSWLIWIARILPVRRFASGMMAGFVGTPFDWTDVLVVAARGVAGLLLAIRFFRWQPRTG